MKPHEGVIGFPLSWVTKSLHNKLRSVTFQQRVRECCMAWSYMALVKQLRTS